MGGGAHRFEDGEGTICLGSSIAVRLPPSLLLLWRWGQPQRVCVCVTNNQQLSETVWSVPSSPKDFLLQIFTVFRILIRPEMFPKDWTVMRLVANK